MWGRDEDAFGEEDEDEMEPPVPVGLGSLTAPQRALADFLRLDTDHGDLGDHALTMSGMAHRNSARRVDPTLRSGSDGSCESSGQADRTCYDRS